MLRLVLLAWSLLCLGVGQEAIAQPSPRQVVPFDAIVESTTSSNVGDKSPHVTLGHLYRDAQGRTRREHGDAVFISDPVLRTTFVLDTKNKTAQQLRASSANSTQKQSQTQLSSADVRTAKVVKPQITREDLGKSVIDGHDVLGRRITTVIPPLVVGNLFRIKVTDETWTSVELGVPIMTSSSDPRQSTTVERLRTILTYPQLDPALFQVPSGFKLKMSTSATQEPSK
jgi:hypothetical protein